ncbi:MAG: hypothetical protein WCG23_11645 [bacterium]
MSALIQATVKYPMREVETRYGKRVNVVLVTNEGEQITQWGKPEDTTLCSLRRNQKVTLVKEQDNKVKIVFNKEEQSVNTEVSNNNLKPEIWGEEEKNKLNLKASNLIAFYESCDALVRQTIKEYKTEESLRSITTTIFLQSVRNV